MILLRYLAGCGLLTLAVCLALAAEENTLLIGTGTGFLLFWTTRRSLSRALLAAMPVAVTAFAYYVLQALAGNTAIVLPLKMVAVFLWLSAALRVLPWETALSWPRPGSPGFHAVLYIHFVGHFLHILGDETLRALRAWAWSSRGAPRTLRIQALRGALSRLALRSIIRAERFYAAQLVRGLAE